MIKHKHLALAAIISAAGGLTACGGGSSDNGGTNNSAGTTPNTGTTTDTTSASTQTYFSYEQVSGRPEDVNNFLNKGYAIQKTKTTVKDGVAYEKFEFPAKSIDFEASDYSQDIFLTKKYVYKTDLQQYDLGYKVAFFDLNNDLKVVYTPYNLSGDHTFKISIERQKVDLYGKKVGSVLFLDSGQSDLINPVHESNAIYPRGSFCYSNLITSISEPVIMVAEALTYQNLEEWITYQETLGARVFVENWAGYQVAGSDTGPYRVVKIDNDVLEADFTPVGEIENIPLQIHDLKNQIKNGFDSPMNIDRLNALENQCSSFNQTAATAIDAVIAQIPSL